jgi:hypothetical protein
LRVRLKTVSVNALQSSAFAGVVPKLERKIMFKLVNKQGKIVKIGDKVTNFRGEVRTVKEIHPPHKPSSSGHVTTEGGFHYVTVYDLEFVKS